MKPAIGIIVALASEGRILGRGRWQRFRRHLFRLIRLADGRYAVAVRCGPGYENALVGARFLNSLDISALIGLGLAGGLLPGARPGDLILADAVLEMDRGKVQDAWQADPACIARCRNAFASEGLPVHCGRLLSGPRPVLTVAQKAALFRSTRALAVDMESAALASAAREKGIPLFVVRAVCDPAEACVRRAFYESIDRAGRLRPLFLLGRLIASPRLAPELSKLSRHYRAAAAALRRGWQILAREPELLQTLTRPGRNFRRP